MTDSLLVIFHEATRTGAPRVLLDLLTHARGRLPLPVAIRLQADGPLGADVRRLAEIDEHESRAAAVVVNGAAAADSLHRIGRGIPTMVYVHEEGEALAALDDRCVTAIVGSGRPGALRVQPVLTSPPSTRCRAGANRGAPSGGPDRGNRSTPKRQRRQPGRWVSTALPQSWSVAAKQAGARGPTCSSTSLTGSDRSGRPGSPGLDAGPASFARLLDHDTHTVGLERNLVWLGELDDVRPLLRRRSGPRHDVARGPAAAGPPRGRRARHGDRRVRNRRHRRSRRGGRSKRCSLTRTPLHWQAKSSHSWTIRAAALACRLRRSAGARSGTRSR